MMRAAPLLSRFQGLGYAEMLDRVPKDVTPLERIRWAGRDLMERHQREDDRWLYELWLECLAHAARYPEFRSLAASFWSGNRPGLAGLIGEIMAAMDQPPNVDPKDIATAVIALDIGLKLQNLVDPEDAPLELYPKLYEALFGPLVAPGSDE